jgi:2-hydroxychromene-2-carboxylate isomerase
MSTPIDWYFDFISPFAYLQWHRLKREAPELDLRPIPLLFAGLLKVWENKGPVEIAPKRSWTYAHCLWIAEQQGIPMRLPTGHPFNPLPLLRLSIALGSSHAVVDRLFAYVWRDGHLPSDPVAWPVLLKELGQTEESLQSDEIKQTLRRHGDYAAAAGVFGVPSAIVKDELIWGLDATDMLIACAADDPFFKSEAYRSAFNLPSGLAKPASAA